MATKERQGLKKKKILITAGPTWVPLDDVRVISNLATGATGISIAKEAKQQGARVTLFLGPSENFFFDGSLRVIRFRYFDEFKKKVIHELRQRKYDIIIHSAAVSDFAPAKKIKGKLVSAGKANLRLKPLPKIIRLIRYYASGAKIVMFKLESHLSREGLIKRARAAARKAKADFVVANQLNPYRAFILGEKGAVVAVQNRSELAKKLLKIVAH